MTAIAAANVAVTVSTRNRDIWPAAPKRCQIALVAFGDGALTYPTGGVPLPAMGVFGFHTVIEFGAIEQPINGFLYKYDRANHKLLIYAQGFTTGATAAAANENGALVVNSAGAQGVPRIPNTAASTTYDMGPLKELPATVAPAAVSFLMMMIGQ